MDHSKTEYSKTEYNNLVSDSDTITDSSNNILDKTESESDASFIHHTWEDEMISKMNDEQYLAFKELLRMVQLGELHSSKNSLLSYFEKMRLREWKDMSGEPIRDIVGYVCSNFNLHYQQKQEELEVFRANGLNPLDYYSMNDPIYVKIKKELKQEREEQYKTHN